MRVCLISSRFFPQIVGSGTSAYVIASQLAKRGHHVTVLTDSGLKQLHRMYDMPFELRYIPQLENFAIGSGSMKAPLETLHGELVEGRFDVIHVCNFMPMLLLNVLKPLINAPIVFSFFNTPLNGKRAIGYSKIHEIDTSIASHIIKAKSYYKLFLGSQHYYEAALSLGASSKDIILGQLGIETELLNMNIQQDTNTLYEKYFSQKLERNEPYIILPSRAVKQKGLVEAVKALEIVRSRGHRFKLVLTGMADPFDKEYAKKVEQLTEQLNLQNEIVAPSHSILRSDLSQFIRDAKLVIVPSHFEGLGMSAIEAQAIGTPLIASNTVGLNEVVQDGYNGLTCQPGAPDDLAECIIKLISDEGLSKEVVSNGKKSSAKYSAQKFVDILERIYKQAVGDYVR